MLISSPYLRGNMICFCLKVPCRYDFVGSFLRPDYLKKARADFEKGAITVQQLKEVEDKAILDLVAKQKKAGYHISTLASLRPFYRSAI